MTTFNAQTARTITAKAIRANIDRETEKMIEVYNFICETFITNAANEGKTATTFTHKDIKNVFDWTYVSILDRLVNHFKNNGFTVTVCNTVNNTEFILVEW